MTSRKGSVSSWHATLAFTLVLALTACSGGGSGSSTSGGGGSNPPPSTANEWTWVGGSSALNQPGVYGTKGVASASNTPGARTSAVGWTDGSGNLWLYGGEGLDSTGTAGEFSDLWEFNATNKLWTWVSGADAPNNSAVYGTGLFTYCEEGVASASNTPGLRVGAAGWTDASGNFWLYGGSFSNSATHGSGIYGDLWEFSPGANEWTWVSGSCGANVPGVYGTQGVASATNYPGARTAPVGWKDRSDNFWLFGGFGYAAISNNIGPLNDLWEFNTKTNQWTWVSGSSTTDQPAIYGTKGVPSASNIPGARYSAVSWTDSSGNFWLFGGFGFLASGRQPALSDLWEFNPATNEWTWVSGSTAANQPGVYGTMGTPSATNVPGARYSAVSWTDSSGNFWLFGGFGFDSTGVEGNLSDLWKFNITTNEWTWVSGSSTANQPGVYGTMGAASASNIPAAREAGVSWMDGSGNLWLYGGDGYGVSGAANNGLLDDLWHYQP